MATQVPAAVGGKSTGLQLPKGRGDANKDSLSRWLDSEESLAQRVLGDPNAVAIWPMRRAMVDYQGSKACGPLSLLRPGHVARSAVGEESPSCHLLRRGRPSEFQSSATGGAHGPRSRAKVPSRGRRSR